MRRVILALPVLWTACSVAPEGQFRAADRAIYSNAVFDAARLEGRWVQIGDFAQPGAPPCSAGGLVVTAAGEARSEISADLCLAGQRRGFQGQAQMSGPGRIRLIGADPDGIGAEWWVLWVDDGYRTLVVGTPSGAFGLILNREPDLPEDRMAAAREILAWNGYDLTRLRRVGAP